MLLSDETKNKYNREAGDRIIRSRKLLGMKQNELADALDIDASMLSRYEQGKTPVPAWILIALEKMIGL